MSVFTDHLKQEHELIGSGLDLLKTYHNDLERKDAISAEDLRMASYTLQLIVESCHLIKEESFLYPSLIKVANEKGRVLEITPNWEDTLEANENTRLCLLRLRLGIDDYAKDPNQIEVVNLRLVKYIQQMTNHIEKEEHGIFILANEILDLKTQKELLSQAQELEKSRGIERLQGPRTILSRLRVAKGMEAE